MCKEQQQQQTQQQTRLQSVSPPFTHCNQHVEANMVVLCGEPMAAVLYTSDCNSAIFLQPTQHIL